MLFGRTSNPLDVGQKGTYGKGYLGFAKMYLELLELLLDLLLLLLLFSLPRT